MEIYLKNTTGKEYKLVPAEPGESTGTLQPAATPAQAEPPSTPRVVDAPQPPPSKLD
jgi:potassium efflux system protein